ncbi:MAG: hypothetical protein JWN40_905 [Phycisphaerales bacterium]|nr:hypothetical protein [Phycisphaerales bacterium]
MGAEGLEPPSVSWRLQIYSLAQSPLCHTPRSVGGRQRADGRKDMPPLPTAYCLLLTAYCSRLVRESNPFQHLDRVPCDPVTPTRPTVLHRASRGIEPSPRHSQCRVLPLHQTRHRANLLAAPLAERVQHQRKRRDSNPHRPIKRTRLANACDETDIRLSSNSVGGRRYAVGGKEKSVSAYRLLPTAYFLHAPARNRTWISSFARSRGFHSTTGTNLAFPLATRF